MPVACTRIPSSKWEEVSDYTHENRDAQIWADFEKLSVMDGEVRRMKEKLKLHQRTVVKRVFPGITPSTKLKMVTFGWKKTQRR